MVRARMRHGSCWQDVTIVNVSNRGMMVRADDAAPAAGSYIEIRRHDQVFVARIVWQAHDRCGLRTQDVVDVPRLTSARGRPAGPASAAPPVERRAGPRDPGAAAERNRLAAMQFERVAIVAAIVAAVALMGSAAYATLSAPLAAVTAALR